MPVTPPAGEPQVAASDVATTPTAPHEYLLRIADDRLVLGHRLSEWCGHAPILEEDIALANVALDLIGQATALLDLAGRREGRGRTADALAYFRETRDWRNVQLVELPNGDFAFTIVRQFLFDAWDQLLLDALGRGADAELAGIAAKAAKEARYHLRHSAEWVVMLGDGTVESHARAQAALDELWRFTGEPFLGDELDASLAAAGIAPDPASLREPWLARVREVAAAATLRLPDDRSVARGGRRGLHTEHLGRMLSEMQSVARAHPGAEW